MRIIVLQNEAMIEDLICSREEITVGSADDCRIRLKGDDVAPQHLLIFPDMDGGWIVEKNGNGATATMNGVELNGRTPLHSGDNIELAGYHLRAFPEYLDANAEKSNVITTREALERFAATQLPTGTILKKGEDSVSLSRNALVNCGASNVALSQCTSPTAFIDMVMQTLFEFFPAHRVWIGLRRYNYGAMEYVEGRFREGQPADLPPIGESLQTRALDRNLYMLVPRISNDIRVSVMAGPLLGPVSPLGMVYMDTGETARGFSEADLDRFIAITTVFAAQLAAIFDGIARHRDALMEGSVSVAHEIQARLTPRKLPQWEELNFGAFREPGRESSGDIYDVVKLVNNLGAFMVAHTDAAGHWPSMLLSQAQAAFRCACMHQDNPQMFLRSLNWLLYDPAEPHPLNCLMGAINPKTGLMRYAVAGEVGANMISARGEARKLENKSPLPALGIDKAVDYPILSEQIEQDETLVIYTPGVTTAQNQNGEVFGADRFVDILCDGFGQLASTTLKEMYNEVRGFTEAGKQPNDITVLLAHRN